MSFAADYGDLFRRAARFVDRILKGAKPAAMPVEPPRKFDLTVNLDTSIVWAGWLYSQEWWRKELWKTIQPPGTPFDQVLAYYRMMFAGIDANDLLLQMRTWENNNVGDTSPFHGDVEAALRSIKRPILYMPSETDRYFPISDTRYEAAFIPHAHCSQSPHFGVILQE